MAKTQTQLSQNPQYDQFLHATVGDDLHGTGVTVLSMLARLGVDPWTEAGALAALPKELARQRLDALMARFRDVPSLIAARTDVVARLLAVLPQGATASPASATAAAPLGPMVYGIPIYVVGAVAAALLLAYLGIPGIGN